MTMAKSHGLGVGEVESGFKRYPKYRDSGVAWLGEIPEHWEVRRLKALSEMRSGESITSKSIRDSGPYPVFGGNGLRGYTSRFTHDGAHLLIGRQGALCGNVHVVHGRFWASEHAVVATPDQPDVVAWFGAVLAAMDLNQYSVAAAQPGLAVDRLRDLHVPVPPDPEKQTIADFLDRETGRIDGLIEKKERLVALLQEGRSALISRAVTKGLDPDVPTRETDVEWLGAIPVHWELRRLKALSEMKSGVSITSKSIRDFGPYPVFGGNGLRGYTSGFTHDGEHLLIGRQGALCGNVHVARGRFWASEHAVVLTPNQPREVQWLRALLEAMDLNQYSFAAAQPGLAVDRLRDLKVPVPPDPERQAISDFLGRETGRIDALVTKVVAAIERLSEYRTALISAVVTGRIDVRDATAFVS